MTNEPFFSDLRSTETERAKKVGWCGGKGCGDVVRSRPYAPYGEGSYSIDRSSGGRSGVVPPQGLESATLGIRDDGGSPP